jgi:hypothetical protein
MLVLSCLAYSSTPEVEVTCSSKMSLYFQRTIQQYISEDKTLHFISPFMNCFMLFSVEEFMCVLERTCSIVSIAFTTQIFKSVCLVQSNIHNSVRMKMKEMTVSPSPCPFPLSAHSFHTKAMGDHVCIKIVMDLFKAFLGNGLVNTFQCATMEDVSQWTNVIAHC